MKRREDFEDFVYEETSIRVAELCGTNSYESEELHEHLLEDRDWRLELAKEWRRRRQSAEHNPSTTLQSP